MTSNWGLAILTPRLIIGEVGDRLMPCRLWVYRTNYRWIFLSLPLSYFVWKNGWNVPIVAECGRMSWNFERFFSQIFLMRFTMNETDGQDGINNQNMRQFKFEITADLKFWNLYIIWNTWISIYFIDAYLLRFLNSLHKKNFKDTLGSECRYHSNLIILCTGYFFPCRYIIWCIFLKKIML